MARTAESPQNIWQARFQQLNPPPFDTVKQGLLYYDLTQPGTWWQNPVKPDSLRLTKFGFETVKTLDGFKFHKFQMKHDIRPKAFVQLERHFKDPYYVQNRSTIHILNEKDALMLMLNASNLHQYLDDLSSQNG